jgi:hypothetical protein
VSGVPNLLERMCSLFKTIASWFETWGRSPPCDSLKRGCLRVEQLETRDCPSTITWNAPWQGPGSPPVNWNDPANWDSHTVPTSADDVVFGQGWSFSDGIDCIYNGPVGDTIANSNTINGVYQGTLHAVSGFTVSDLLELDNGNLDQPGGAGVSDITVRNFNWSGGAVLGPTAKAALKVAGGGRANLTGANLTTGSDFILDNSTVYLNNTGNLTFNNNAGISMSNNAGFNWQSGTANIVTAGTGTIQNNGGFFT